MSIRTVALAGLAAIGLAALASSAWVVATGGNDMAVAGLRLSMRNAARPFLVAGAAATLLARLEPRWRMRVDRLATRTAALPHVVALAAAVALALCVSLIGVRYGSFVDVPALVQAKLPANAIYLTRAYSGSLRYYPDRPTLRWDVLDPDWLDAAVDQLRARGFVPLIVIEMGDEDRDYRERFRGSRLGALDWPSIAEYHAVQTVRIFDPAQRR